MIPKFFGTIKQGKVVVEKNYQYQGYLKSLENQKIEIVVRKWRKTRSQKQSRYYWGVVIKLLCDWTGYTAEEMHEILKRMFNSKRMKIGDNHIVIGESTTKLTTTEFSEYCTNIQAWAAGYGVNIPDPNEGEAE